jgi:anti-sigma B factor antagonist
MDFRIDASFTPPLAVLRVRGELDLSTAETLSWSVAQAIERGCGLVLLDLGDVCFVDCSGIGALVEAVHRMDAASAHLSVNRVSPQVARMLELTGTDALFGLRGVVQGRTS